MKHWKAKIFLFVVRAPLNYVRAPLKKYGGARGSSVGQTFFPPWCACVCRPARLAQHENVRESRRTLPPRAVIEDQMGNFPISLPKSGRCKNTPCAASVITYCIKCNVYLCINGRHCYLDIHGIDHDLDSLPH